MLVHEHEPFNAEPLPEALADRLLTPTETFYSRNHGPVPAVDPASWRLVVDGQVSHPTELTLTDLTQQFAEHTVVATLECAGNRRAGFVEVRNIPNEDPWRDGAISTASWTGVRLADVLATVGVQPAADGAPAGHVAFGAPDVCRQTDPPQPFGGSIPLAKALSAEVLLAWAMNGQPLAPVHGAPVRVVVPAYIGARSVKWVDRITVQDAPSANYFQAVAYRMPIPGRDAEPGDGFALGSAGLNSAILSPCAGARLAAGSALVRGYAYSGGGRRVARVEVSTDDGSTWTSADLGADAGPWAWRLWAASIEIPPGHTRIMARAWDDAAAVQVRDPAMLWNPKGYMNTSWPRVDVHADPQ